MARRPKRYRGSGPAGGYTEQERARIPDTLFLKPSTRKWPVGDRRHVSIALQYMQRGFGNRAEYPQLLARLLELWPPSEHPDVFAELESKLPSIASMIYPRGRRAAANPTSLEAEVQRMMDHPPASWQMMFQRYGLKTGDSPQKVINVVLEFTPSMSDYGPKGKGGFVPPDAARKAALLGLRLSYENDYTSASGIGVARAMQLALSPTISQRSVSRMAAYFGRHKKDQNARNFGNIDNPSRGYMAWLNWGGTPGYKWALKQVRAKPNPDVYDPEIELIIASKVVRDAAYDTVDESNLDRNRYDVMDSLRSKLKKQAKSVDDVITIATVWANTHLSGQMNKDNTKSLVEVFGDKLREYNARARKNIRGIKGLHPARRTKVARSAIDHGYTDIITTGTHTPKAYRRKRVSSPYQSRQRAKKEEERRQLLAYKLLGWTQLPSEHEGEYTEWKCAYDFNQADIMKFHQTKGEFVAPECRHKLIDLPDDEDYMLWVKDRLNWVDLSKFSDEDRQRIIKRLQPEWVRAANKHDSRRFFGDLASGSSKEALDWMDERKPSRRAVEKSLRKYINSLPADHDFSDRPTPSWVRSLGGSHAKNNIEMRKMGKKHGWCFGGEYYGRYLQDILNGDELYFVQLNGTPVAVHVIRLEGDDSRNRKRYKDELGFFSVEEAKYPQNEDAIYDIEDFLKGNNTKIAKNNRRPRSRSKRSRRSRSSAKSNPDVYSPDVELLIAKKAVLSAARAALGESSLSVTRQFSSFGELDETLHNMNKRGGKRLTIGEIVQRWARENLKSNKARDVFRKELARASKELRRNLRGIMALPPKGPGEETDPRAMAVDLVLESGKPFHRALAVAHDQERAFQHSGSGWQYAPEPPEGAVMDPTGQIAKAAKILGWTHLPPQQHMEQTQWVCAAEPDAEKCKSITIWEKDGHEPDEYVGPIWQETKHVADPLWWYDLNVMPYASRDEVQQRLGAEWVHTANKHDSRRFFGDIAAHPSATLDWLDQRTPSRKAVEKSLRKYVETLPVSHDYSARPTPRWVQRLNGHHAEDENEVKAIGRRYGWCFGGVHNAGYLSMIDADHELYFAVIKNRPVAIFIKRGTQGEIYDADLNRWSAASVYEDEFGPFALIEAKYPQNDEAYRDVQRSLAGLKYDRAQGRRRKKTERRR